MKQRSREFVRSIKKDLTDKDIQVRMNANLTLVSYDYGRATCSEDMDRAFDEWNFRNFAFVQGWGNKRSKKNHKEIPVNKEERDLHKKKVKEYWDGQKEWLEKVDDDPVAYEKRYNWLAKMEPCCHDEERNFNGWCVTCGDPCF